MFGSTFNLSRASPYDVPRQKVVSNAVADVFTAAVLGKPIGMSDGSASTEEKMWVENGMRSVHLMAQPLDL